MQICDVYFELWSAAVDAKQPFSKNAARDTSHRPKKLATYEKTQEETKTHTKLKRAHNDT
jgi:hypothetical protein